MTALEEAKQALAKLRVDYPFKLVTTGSGDPHGLPGTVTGILRAKSGQALIVPIPDSATTVAGLPGTLEFFAKSAELLSNLVDSVEKGLDKGDILVRQSEPRIVGDRTAKVSLSPDM